MCEFAIYSVASPEACAAIVWRDSNKAEEAANAMQLNAENILKLKLIDEIIPEPLGGAHKNPDQMANTLKASIVNNLKNLQLIDTTELLSRRYNRLMSYGEI